MATEIRHAAWQARSFAVRMLVEQGSPEELASGLTEFLDALDVVFEWLNREDPGREGQAQLAIFEIRDGVAEEVWTYPPPQSDDAQELVKLFGFDPVAWDAGVREFSAETWTTRLSPGVPEAIAPPRVAQQQYERPSAEKIVSPEQASRVAPPEPDNAPTDDDAAVPPLVERPHAELDPAPEPSRVQPAVARESKPPVHETARVWIAATARSTWDDPVSRGLLFLAIAGLWFAFALADPVFLLLLLVSLPFLWWRQQRRTAVSETDFDDWL
jgi:hypothetical protein